ESVILWGSPGRGGARPGGRGACGEGPSPVHSSPCIRAAVSFLLSWGVLRRTPQTPLTLAEGNSARHVAEFRGGDVQRPAAPRRAQISRNSRPRRPMLRNLR